MQANLMITLTGGQGDVEAGVLPVPDSACQMHHSAFGIVADGPAAVRKAAVAEANNRKTYVAAHAYTAEAIQLAVRNGVKCIVQGNLLVEKTADIMVEHDAWLVPTLVTCKGMASEGRKLGFPDRRNPVNAKTGIRRSVRGENCRINSSRDVCDESDNPATVRYHRSTRTGHDWRRGIHHNKPVGEYLRLSRR